jgi:hypothetical protein
MSTVKLIKLRQPIKLEVEGRTVRVHRVAPGLLHAAEILARGEGTELSNAWIEVSFVGPTGRRHRHPVDLHDDSIHAELQRALSQRYHLNPGDVADYFKQLNHQALAQLLEVLMLRVRDRPKPKRPDPRGKAASAWPFAGVM